MTESFDPELIIDKVENNQKLEESEVEKLIEHSMDQFLEDNNIIILQSPIIICGDIHGQLEDLFQLFKVSGDKKMDKYLFMGDYVDRGYYSIDTICYLIALRLKYNNVFLLRGNHESRSINMSYGFYSECQKAFTTTKIYDLFNYLFDLFPLAALIDNKVFSVHGGISPSLPYIQILNEEERDKEIPASGVIADLTWSDPEENINGFEINSRGSGFLFGKEPLINFVHNNDLVFVTRSHQLVEVGFKWFFDEKLINIWSAPNYAYVSNNKATVMKYEGNRTPEIIDFDQNNERRPVIPEIQFNQYFV